MTEENLSFFYQKRFKLVFATSIFVMLTVLLDSVFMDSGLSGLLINLRNDTLSNVTTQIKLAPPTPKHWTRNKALDSRIDTNTSRRKGIILFWNSYWLTSGVGLDRVRTVSYDCGVYQCNVTKDRSFLHQSNVIIFNPRAIRGMFSNFYVLLLRFS